MSTETYKGEQRYRCDWCKKLVPKEKQVTVDFWTKPDGEPYTKHYCSQAHYEAHFKFEYQLQLL
jgi:hypothetical protein